MMLMVVHLCVMIFILQAQKYSKRFEKASNNSEEETLGPGSIDPTLGCTNPPQRHKEQPWSDEDLVHLEI